MKLYIWHHVLWKSPQNTYLNLVFFWQESPYYVYFKFCQFQCIVQAVLCLFSNTMLKIIYNELLLLSFCHGKNTDFSHKLLQNWTYLDIVSALELQIYIFCIEELNIIMLKTRFFLLQFQEHINSYFAPSTLH